MFKWIERLKRVDALEAEIATLRAEMVTLRAETASLALEAERTKARTAAIDALGDRLATLKDHVAIDIERSTATGRAVAALGERIDAIERRAADAVAAQDQRHAEAAKPTEDELASQRTALLRLEHRMRLDAEAADAAMRALLERIEPARTAGD